ncbi:hypothetical protein SDC9_60135 [bioreactor metagenome]|uniref:Uncharacterized protein n=1 Tax=bioreactor metagenome TaxID=1076179 RepID=A0A644XC30_9ZZZZ
MVVIGRLTYSFHLVHDTLVWEALRVGSIDCCGGSSTQIRKFCAGIRGGIIRVLTTPIDSDSHRIVIFIYCVRIGRDRKSVSDFLRCPGDYRIILRAVYGLIQRLNPKIFLCGILVFCNAEFRPGLLVDIGKVNRLAKPDILGVVRHSVKQPRLLAVVKLTAGFYIGNSVKIMNRFLGVGVFPALLPLCEDGFRFSLRNQFSARHGDNASRIGYNGVKCKSRRHTRQQAHRSNDCKDLCNFFTHDFSLPFCILQVYISKIDRRRIKFLPIVNTILTL